MENMRGKPFTHRVLIKVKVDDNEYREGLASETAANTRATMLNNKAKKVIARVEPIPPKKEDYSPAAPTTAPNTSLGIKAGPIQIGKKQKGGGKQGSQRAPSETQIIMASYEWDKQPVKQKKQKATTVNPMDKTNTVFVSANETLSPSASSGDWIDDFVHSKNPKFEGKSKKERIKMALGAYYAHRNEQVTEAQEHDSTDVHPKDFIHAGFGAPGGAGIHGHVNKVVGKTVHFTGTETHVGIDGRPHKKTYKVPIGNVTVLHREGVIVDLSDLDPIFEAHKPRKLTASLVDLPKNNTAQDPLPVKESLTPLASNHKNYHEWEQHAKKLGGSDFHERKVPASQHVKPEHTTHVRRIVNGKPEYVGSWNHLTHSGNIQPVKPLKEDTIFEAGSKTAMKRKYLGKTRGTTATGKKAHEVVIDPVLKLDDNRNNSRPSLPAPDRGV